MGDCILRRAAACGVFVGLVCLPAVATAQAAPPESGQELFHMYCEVCHGAGAKGDGPVASLLKTPPADLTGIAARGNGTFDAEMIKRVIDGRNPVKGHGGGDMPVWGDAFARTHDATPSAEKIDLLVGYLKSIQAKP